MALWGISTTTETEANNYAIPKYTSGSTQFDGVDINNTPHNFFADNRGWVYRHYQDNKYSGLSSSFYDEVHVAVAGLNTTGISSNTTGLGVATPVAVFFKDPNNGNPISVGGGSTNFISTATSAEVHLCFNETVFAGAGSTVKVRVFDANGENEAASVIAYASSVSPNASIPVYMNSDGLTLYEGFNGQITNRVAFGFTSPGTLLTADVNYLTTAVSTGNTVAVGGTIIAVNALIQTVEDIPGLGFRTVSVGDSVTAGGITLGEIVSVGSTTVTISSASTSSTGVAPGTAVTFSRRATELKLALELGSGFVGVITDISGGAGVTSSFSADILRQVGGAGTSGHTTSDTYPLGLGTTTLSVKVNDL